uniref:(California timema) hypothetical protein n=1 Tax=Timema californicum TaxID=61474 RepID=A0A7R9J8K0_TIMCA|nr:unnamed protein product [Timema californicum]
MVSRALPCFCDRHVPFVYCVVCLRLVFPGTRKVRLPPLPERHGTSAKRRLHWSRLLDVPPGVGGGGENHSEATERPGAMHRLPVAPPPTTRSGDPPTAARCLAPVTSVTYTTTTAVCSVSASTTAAVGHYAAPDGDDMSKEKGAAFHATLYGLPPERLRTTRSQSDMTERTVTPEGDPGPPPLGDSPMDPPRPPPENLAMPPTSTTGEPTARIDRDDHPAGGLQHAGACDQRNVTDERVRDSPSNTDLGWTTQPAPQRKGHPQIQGQQKKPATETGPRPNSRPLPRDRWDPPGTGPGAKATPAEAVAGPSREPTASSGKRAISKSSGKPTAPQTAPSSTRTKLVPVIVCEGNFKTTKRLSRKLAGGLRMKWSTNRVTFYVNTLVDHSTLLETLVLQGYQPYTFPTDGERDGCLVIRGLPVTSPCEDVQATLMDKGYQVRRVTRLGATPTGPDQVERPFPLFLVTLVGRQQLQRLSVETVLSHMKESLEPFRRKDVAQQVSVTPPSGIFAKSGEAHASSICEHPRTDPARCANCGEAHPVNAGICAQVHRDASALGVDRPGSPVSPNPRSSRTTRPSAPHQRLGVSGVARERLPPPPSRPHSGSARTSTRPDQTSYFRSFFKGLSEIWDLLRPLNLCSRLLYLKEHLATFIFNVHFLNRVIISAPENFFEQDQKGLPILSGNTCSVTVNKHGDFKIVLQFKDSLAPIADPVLYQLNMFTDEIMKMRSENSELKRPLEFTQSKQEKVMIQLKQLRVLKEENVVLREKLLKSATASMSERHLVI